MGTILNQEVDQKEITVGTFSKKFTEAQLKYPVGQQELLVAHEDCRYFEPLIKGCDVTIMTNHLNNTFDFSKAPNLRTTRQLIELDQEFHVKRKHIAGVDNTGADGLSRHKIITEVPKDVKMKLYKCNSLDRGTNEMFPVDMRFIKKCQEEAC